MRTRLVNGVREYECRHCSAWRKRSEMCRARHCPLGITGECKACRNERRNIARDRRKSSGFYGPRRTA